MSDIVERIRSLRYVHVPVASSLFSEAVDEIIRLRAEIASLRLTDEEREAIEGVIAVEHQRGAWKWADTLSKLLARLA